MKHEKKTNLLIGGGLFGAFIASLCCIGPLILTLLGVSGAAVLSNFSVLRIPLIIIVIIVFIIAGFYLYRKRNTCEPGELCADPKKFRKMVIFYFIGLVLAALFITSPYWVAWIFS